MLQEFKTCNLIVILTDTASVKETGGLKKG